MQMDHKSCIGLTGRFCVMVDSEMIEFIRKNKVPFSKKKWHFSTV